MTGTRGCRPPTVFTVLNGNNGAAARVHLYVNVSKSSAMGCATPAAAPSGATLRADLLVAF